MSIRVSGNKYKYKASSTIAGILICLIIIFSSCNNNNSGRKVDRGFYYWKSVFNISPFEKKLIDSLQITTLSVKYFDVDWDNEHSKAIPKAIIREGSFPNDLPKIIPCIFITNNCIRETDSSMVDALAENIVALISQINQSLHVSHVEELQIDCDWTAATRNVYFRLLEAIRVEMKKQSSLKTAKLCATIRLYQVKYRNKTGIPPVDRGLLMAYNMGNLKDPASSNSILEVSELKKYISQLERYPLELDVALPVFGWTVLFRNSKYAGLLPAMEPELFSEDQFQKLGNNKFKLLVDTVVNGFDLKKDDLLRLEGSEIEEILNTGKVLSRELKTMNLRLSLFHLDSITLSKYSFHEMETIFRSLD